MPLPKDRKAMPSPFYIYNDNANFRRCTYFRPFHGWCFKLSLGPILTILYVNVDVPDRPDPQYIHRSALCNRATSWSSSRGLRIQAWKIFEGLLAVVSESAAMELTTSQVAVKVLRAVPYDDDGARQELRKVKTLSNHNILHRAYINFIEEFRNSLGHLVCPRASQHC